MAAISIQLLLWAIKWPITRISPAKTPLVGLPLAHKTQLEALNSSKDTLHVTKASAPSRLIQ